MILTGNVDEGLLRVLLRAADQGDANGDIGELLGGGPLDGEGAAFGDLLLLGGPGDGVEGRVLGDDGGGESQEGGGGELHFGCCVL